nr:MAG TPA: hypothetical protein [Caudoviricetes sp.]
MNDKRLLYYTIFQTICQVFFLFFFKKIWNSLILYHKIH